MGTGRCHGERSVENLGTGHVSRGIRMGKGFSIGCPQVFSRVPAGLSPGVGVVFHRVFPEGLGTSSRAVLIQNRRAEGLDLAAEEGYLAKQLLHLLIGVHDRGVVASTERSA